LSSRTYHAVIVSADAEKGLKKPFSIGDEKYSDSPDPLFRRNQAVSNSGIVA
jgi:hypothetical protein